MDYEKKYKEALKRATKARNNASLSKGTLRVLGIIFPELRESEDERIRKAQLDYWRSVGGKEWHGVLVQETIAWLEKQGDVKFPEVPIEHGKYYYCIKDYYSGGNLRAKRGDVVQALRGMSIMMLDSTEAGKYFLPANKIEKQGEQKPTLRERYENIAQSEWFKKTHEGMSISDDEESKWTEEDEKTDD